MKAYRLVKSNPAQRGGRPGENSRTESDACDCQAAPTDDGSTACWSRKIATTSSVPKPAEQDLAASLHFDYPPRSRHLPASRLEGARQLARDGLGRCAVHQLAWHPCRKMLEAWAAKIE